MKGLWLLLAVMLLSGCGRKVSTPMLNAEQQRAIEAAQQAFQKRKAEGKSMSRGPCLGEVIPGWVADVVHNPRQPIDEDPANQCAEYRKGKVKHFVELDMDGNVVRVQ